MANILSTALSGLNASRHRMLTAANNLSNLNTPGYQSQRTNTSTGPNGNSAVTDSISVSSNEGSLTPTDNPLDMAINGQGFFQVSDGAGNNFFTRAGNFSVGQDGTLVNSQGLTLQTGINIPQEAQNIQVGNDGTVSAQMPDGTTANLGQIELANFSNPQGLSRQGGNLQTQTGASGAPQLGLPGTGGRGFIQSGFLEGSNVDIAQEAINLVHEESMTEANAAVVKTADEMQKTAIDLMA